MKLHWGHKIVGGMILFMLFILSMSYYMFLQHKDTLVDEHYYEAGLEYDEDLKKQTNALDPKEIPSIELKGEELVIHFKKPSMYQLSLKRPSDASLDQNFESKTPLKNVRLGVGDIKKGLWKVEIFWTAGAKDFVLRQYLTKK